jgi:hypothetical protein
MESVGFTRLSKKVHGTKKVKNPGINKRDVPLCVGTRKGSQQPPFPIYVRTTFHIPIIHWLIS